MKQHLVLTFLGVLIASLGLVPSAQALRADKGQVFLDSLEDYNRCQGHDYSGEFCQDALERWVSDHPDDVFKAAKMTRLKMNSYVAVKLFAQAFDRKKGDCKDQDVHLAVIAGLGLPESYTEQVAQSKKIAFELCFDQLKDQLIKESTVGSYTFKNSCKELDAKGLLSGLKKKKCAEIGKGT